jgi:hypothetical protein
MLTTDKFMGILGLEGIDMTVQLSLMPEVAKAPSYRMNSKVRVAGHKGLFTVVGARLSWHDFSVTEVRVQKGKVLLTLPPSQAEQV